MKKIITGILIILVFFSFNLNKVQASIFTAGDETKSEIQETIDEDEGGLFEKIIAKMIGGLAETVLNLTTNEAFGVGFKNYDELIFAKNSTDISPFTTENWNLMITWYWRIAGIIGIPILIAIIVLAYKLMVSSFNIEHRTEAKDNVMRLAFGAIAIMVAPFFVKFLLFINNSMVKLLIMNSNNNLEDLLGNSIISQIQTGNAIATALVIALFAYLFAVINIRFIIRQFTIIVFTIFTPIVTVFWIMNKRTIASSIWFGQIFINVFMQFIYAFLFLIYMDFLPKAGGWASSILWAMMVLPLADALQNTMQNLVSKMAGVDNAEIASRGIGMGAAMGYTVNAIAHQFKSNDTNQEGEQNIVNKIINRNTNTTEATEVKGSSYESYSRNIFGNQEENNQQVDTKYEKKENGKTNSNIVKAYNVGKETLNLGMYMAEGKNYRNNNMNNYKESNRNTEVRNKPTNEINERTNKIIIEEMNDEEY